MIGSLRGDAGRPAGARRGDGRGRAAWATGPRCRPRPSAGLGAVGERGLPPRAHPRPRGRHRALRLRPRRRAAVLRGAARGPRGRARRWPWPSCRRCRRPPCPPRSSRTTATPCAGARRRQQDGGPAAARAEEPGSTCPTSGGDGAGPAAERLGPGRGPGGPGRAGLRPRRDPRGAGRRSTTTAVEEMVRTALRELAGPMTPEARREVLAGSVDGRSDGRDRGQVGAEPDAGPASARRPGGGAGRGGRGGRAPAPHPGRVRGPGPAHRAPPDRPRGGPAATAAGRPPPLRRAARAGQDLAGRDRGRRDGGRAPDHRRARCWSGRATWPRCSPTSRRATCSSSTRSTGSTGRSRRSSTRPWRTSSWTSSSARARRPAASGSICPASPWWGPPPGPDWWPGRSATASGSSAASTSTTSTSSRPS